jgi:hypothetical protein
VFSQQGTSPAFCGHGFYQFIYQFDRKKTGFVQLMKNVASSEKTEKAKKRRVITNSPSWLIN